MADLHHRPHSTSKTTQTLDFIGYRGACPQSYRVTGTGERVMEMLAGKIFAPAFRAPPPAPARPSAPFRVLSRFSARVVLALRATTKRGTSDAPGELASISVAAVLFVSFRVSRRRAFVSGARGGDKSRDALRRTGRDAVSGPRATPRIKVAQQPASTPPTFVVARSAPIATRAGGEQIFRSQASPSLAAGIERAGRGECFCSRWRAASIQRIHQHAD